MSDAELALVVRNAQVTALLEEFVARIDSGEDVADLFHEDAVFVTPRGVVNGAAAIAASFSDLAKRNRESGRLSRHMVSGVRSMPAGDGSLEVRSKLLAFSAPARGSAGAVLVGDQRDLVVQSASGRRVFARRELDVVMDFALEPLKPGGG